MGNLKAILPILLSLLIAAAGSFYLYQWVQARTIPGQAVTMEKVDAVPVVVAKMDLTWGTRLTAEMVETTPFLTESLPNGFFGNPEAVAGRVVTTPLKAGDPVVEHRLAATDIKVGGVSAVLKAGKRAVAVRGDKVIGLSGFITPGNRVDVLVTINDPEKKEEKSKTVLENILVLASGTDIAENEKGGTSPVDVYTLEVSPEEAEILVLAATKGKLQFSLRGVIDDDTITTRGVNIPELLTSLAVEAPAPVKKKPRPRRIVRRKPVPKNDDFTAESIRGITVSKENFTVK